MTNFRKLLLIKKKETESKVVSYLNDTTKNSLDKENFDTTMIEKIENRHAFIVVKNINQLWPYVHFKLLSVA